MVLHHSEEESYPLISGFQDCRVPWHRFSAWLLANYAMLLVGSDAQLSLYMNVSLYLSYINSSASDQPCQLSVLVLIAHNKSSLLSLEWRKFKINSIALLLLQAELVQGQSLSLILNCSAAISLSCDWDLYVICKLPWKTVKFERINTFFKKKQWKEL